MGQIHPCAASGHPCGASTHPCARPAASCAGQTLPSAAPDGSCPRTDDSWTPPDASWTVLDGIQTVHFRPCGTQTRRAEIRIAAHLVHLGLIPLAVIRLPDEIQNFCRLENGQRKLVGMG